MTRSADLELSRGDLRQQSLFDGAGGGIAQQTPAEHDRAHIRFQQQSLPDELHDGHDVHTAAAEPAEFLGIGQPQETELGILRPRLRGVAER